MSAPPGRARTGDLAALRQTPEWGRAAHFAAGFARDNGLAIASGAISHMLITLVESGGAIDDEEQIAELLLSRLKRSTAPEAINRARRVAERLSNESHQVTARPTPALSALSFAWRIQFEASSASGRRWGAHRPVTATFTISMKPIDGFSDVLAQNDDALAFTTAQNGLRPALDVAHQIRGAFAAWFDGVADTLTADDAMSVQDAVKAIREGLDQSDLGKVRSASVSTVADVVDLLERVKAHILSRVLAPAITRRIREEAGYDDFVARFSIARGISRRHLLIVGPTNSGKTHRALELAGAAASAVVLSPLRLLALEHHEALQERFGVVSGMITGEEVILPPGATHVAQTIETLDTGKIVDVAVIDEIQMLKDPDRGWAWTQALVGAPARLVVSTGSADAVPVVSRIAALCDEEIEVIHLDRKSPLSFAPKPVPVREIRSGDAVICFSRRDLFTWRELLVRRGLSVAAVYGALGPEVRRAEAARFRKGEADVLVATDAIGMGLNFGPLKRVLFTALSKWDGTRERSLGDAEILQIGGRAGRYGHQSDGVAGVLEGVAPNRLVQAGSTPLPPLRLDTLFVQPDRDTVLRAHAALATSSLAEVMTHLGRHLVAESSAFRCSDLNETIRKARILDGTSLPPADKSVYVHCPIDGGVDASQMLRRWAEQHADGQSPSAPAVRLSAGLGDLESLSKIQTAFLWLARRYPDVYDQEPTVRREQRSVNAEIADLLLRSAGSRAGRKQAVLETTR